MARDTCWNCRGEGTIEVECDECDGEGTIWDGEIEAEDPGKPLSKDEFAALRKKELELLASWGGTIRDQKQRQQVTP